MYTDKPYNQREGITLGTLQDVCQDCAKEGHYKPGELEYKLQWYTCLFMYETLSTKTR